VTRRGEGRSLFFFNRRGEGEDAVTILRRARKGHVTRRAAKGICQSNGSGSLSVGRVWCVVCVGGLRVEGEVQRRGSVRHGKAEAREGWALIGRRGGKAGRSSEGEEGRLGGHR